MTKDTHTQQETNQHLNSEVLGFKVAYAKLGEIYHDAFITFNEALADYERKKELDKEGIFDDRFVIHIEDANGKVIHPKRSADNSEKSK